MNDSITPRELQAMLSGANPPRLLDVREPEEFDIARLPNSVLIPLGQIPARLAELKAWADEHIVVYCHHGIRSLHALNYLQQTGFTNLSNLTGGIDAWSREIDPLVPRY
jgi:rhodanese-related sulfurtransferase